MNLSDHDATCRRLASKTIIHITSKQDTLFIITRTPFTRSVDDEVKYVIVVLGRILKNSPKYLSQVVSMGAIILSKRTFSPRFQSFCPTATQVSCIVNILSFLRHHSVSVGVLEISERTEGRAKRTFHLGVSERSLSILCHRCAKEWPRDSI